MLSAFLVYHCFYAICLKRGSTELVEGDDLYIQFICRAFSTVCVSKLVCKKTSALCHSDFIINISFIWRNILIIRRAVPLFKAHMQKRSCISLTYRKVCGLKLYNNAVSSYLVVQVSCLISVHVILAEKFCMTYVP